jgi:hypothetical protein
MQNLIGEACYIAIFLGDRRRGEATTVISCGLPAGYAIFFPKNNWPCGISIGAGYLTYFLLYSLTNGFLINFIQTILLYSYVILNIFRHSVSNQQMEFGCPWSFLHSSN